MQRMVAIHQHPARLANRRWSEPRPGPVGGAEIEWDAGDANRRAGIDAVDAEEGRRQSECWHPGHHYPELEGVNKNTAAATTQVQSPSGDPWAVTATECVSTMRLLIS